MKTIVVMNLKGGVGKTTSVVNIGYSMSLLGKKVLLIDADPQTNMTPFFVKANQNGRTIKDIFQNPERIENIIVKSKYENIDIVKGSTELKEDDAKPERALSAALQLVKDRYNVCLIDTRPAVESITRNALYAGDLFLTPVLLDNFCRDNLILLEDELNNLFHGEFNWHIFANKVANKKSQRNIYADMIGKHDFPFLETCISRGAVTENALELYKPVMKHRSRSQVAQDYMDLAKELLEV